MPSKPQISKRVYVRGDTKTISLRMPVKLKTVLETIAEDKGYSFTDIVLTVLDQYAQQESNEIKPKSLQK